MSTLPDDGREIDRPDQHAHEGEDESTDTASISWEVKDCEAVKRPLNPYAVLRLIQCPRCSQVLRTPLRLPCGNTLCRSCLPSLSRRVGISYPQEAGREEGFTCPWKGKGCGNLAEHSMGDCGVDVTVSKVVDVFEKVLGDKAVQDSPSVGLRWTLPGDGDDDGDGEANREKMSLPNHQSATVQHGRYTGTYMLIKKGILAYDIKDVAYESIEDLEQRLEINKTDEVVLKKLKEGVRTELDCQVCYGLMLDPLTSPCGHTFCRQCVARVLDHSNLCPICRRKLSMPPALLNEPINRVLSGLTDNFYPEEIAARKESTKDDNVLGEDKNLPLFVCTLSFPFMPTFLHVFEPRYRLMMRRALADGGRKFGMVIYNYTGGPQGNLGRTQFMEYGTTLMIDRYELLPDGRSLLSAMGLTKFKVVEWGILDGYYIAKTERVDDITLAEEESFEARERAAAGVMDIVNTSQDGDVAAVVPLEALSTQELMQLCLDFVEKRRAESAPWLHQRVLMAYGEPPTDPARFPYWLASVLPIPEEEKYALLPLTSVRARLKTTARWVRKLENMEW